MQKSICKPQSWEEFEDLCLALWKAIWNDPHAQKYSTNQKGQKGIDIDGHLNGGQDRHAIQCKANTKSDKLDLAQLRKDIENAHEKQNPPLKELIIATTASRDPDNQDFINQISLEFLQQGSFRVILYSWEEIEAKLHEYPEVAGKFYPEFLTAMTRLGTGIYLKYQAKQLDQRDSQTYETVINLFQETFSQVHKIPLETSETDFGKESTNLLDEIRNCINSDKITLAFEKLEEYKQKYYAIASNEENFRYYYYLGDSYNEINDIQNCADNFLKAYNCNPESPSANKIKALASVITGELSQALEYAQKVIEIDPCNEISYQVIAQVCPEKSFEEIISPIPDEKRTEAPVAFAIAEVARRKGNIETSIEWLRKALDKEQENYKIKLHLSLALFEYGLNESLLSYYGRINPDAENSLKQAIQFWDEACAQIKSDEKLLKSKAYMFINKANAYRILGEHQKAIEEFEKYFNLEDSINSEAIRLRALLALQMNDFKLAENFIKGILDDDSSLEIRLMLAEALKFQGKYEEAISLIKNDILTNYDEKDEEANRILIHLYLDQNQKELALEHLEQLLKDEKRILWLVDKAIVQNRTGNSSDASKTLQEAKAQLHSETSIKEKFDLAMAFYELKQYKESSELLSQIDTIYNDSFLSRRLIYAYYLSGNEFKALEVCQQLRKNSNIVDYAAELEVYIYEKVGDYNKAVDLCSQIIEKYPESFEPKLKKALLCYSLGQLNEVELFLKEEIKIDKSIRIESGINYAYLLKEMGYLEKAINSLYELRRVNFNAELAHLKFAGIFLEQNTKITTLEALENPNSVQENTAVNVQHPDGNTEWYIIETRDDADFRFKELAVNHPTAQTLLEKKVGDTTTTGRKVLEIIHKYFYAYNETLQLYEAYFPESHAIERIEVPCISEENNTFESLRPLLDRVDKQQVTVKKIEELYNSGHLTIGAMGALTGRNPIKVWANLLANPNTHLATTTGGVKERESAINNLKNDTVILVLDIISLLTIHELGIADLVKTIYKNLVVCWPTFHLITEYLIETRSVLETGYLTVGKEGTNYVKYEVKPEHIQRQCDFLKTLQYWIKDNCSIEPVYELLDSEKPEGQELSEALGDSFYQTILLSRRENSLLFTDDVRLRDLARNEHGTSGAWTQAILFDLLDRGVLDNARFSELVIRLIELNYDYVSINWMVLLESLKRSEWRCEGIFEKVVNIILSQKTTFHSSIGVLGNFYFELWRENISLEVRERVLNFTIQKLYEKGKNTTWQAFEEALKEALPGKILKPVPPSKIPILMLQFLRRLLIQRFSSIEFTKVQVLNLFDEYSQSIPI